MTTKAPTAKPKGRKVAAKAPGPGVLEKEARVVALRRQGLTFWEIAQEVGYASAGGVYNAYQAAMKRTLVASGVEEMRELEGLRLDKLQAAAWPNAIKGDPAAIAVVLRVMDRRARLYGLDAPTKIQAEVTTYEGGTDIDREVARLADLLASTEGGSGPVPVETPAGPTQAITARGVPKRG